MKIGLVKTCDFLPKPKVKASQFPVHISYLLQKCKKGQTQRNKFALIKKRYHNQLKRCQNSRYIAETCNSTLKTGMDDITGFLGL